MEAMLLNNNLTHYAMLKGLDVSVPDRLSQLQFRIYFTSDVPAMTAIHIAKKWKNAFFATFLFLSYDQNFWIPS